MIVCMARPFSVRPSQRQIDQAKESETTTTTNEKSDKTQKIESNSSPEKNDKILIEYNPEKNTDLLRSEKTQCEKPHKGDVRVSRSEKTQWEEPHKGDVRVPRSEKTQWEEPHKGDVRVSRSEKIQWEEPHKGNVRVSRSEKTQWEEPHKGNVRVSRSEKTRREKNTERNASVGRREITHREKIPGRDASVGRREITHQERIPGRDASVGRREIIHQEKIPRRDASVGRREITHQERIPQRDASVGRREITLKGENSRRDASVGRESKKDKDVTTLIEDKIKILNQSAEKKQKSPGRLKEIDLDRIRLNSKSSVEYLVSKFNKYDKSDKNLSCETEKSSTCSDKECLLLKEDEKCCKSDEVFDQCDGVNDLSGSPLEKQIKDFPGFSLQDRINDFSGLSLEDGISDLSELPLEDRIKSIVLDEVSSFSEIAANVFKFEKIRDLSQSSEKEKKSSPILMPTSHQGDPLRGGVPKTSHRGNVLQGQVPTSHHKSNSGNSANITDSEKIYHKLNGVAKVSKPKSVSPRTRRLSGSRSRGLIKSPDSYRKNGIVKSNLPSTASIDTYLEYIENDQVDMKLKSNRSDSCEPELIVRQCRVGSSVVFGLIQVQKEPNGNGYPEGHGLVTIRMKPDDQGRFGFNVKGGADQGMPIIVSRVAPNTPADLAIPRLNEGDQVLFINGRDVSQHSHEQVVMFIRASRETHSGELVLIVRPNVYVGEEQVEEPDFVYIPESHQITSSATGANALDASLMLLQESLESGAALAQFDQLYRKKPGMTTNAARVEANVPKNRYRDISPYDQTRVILKDRSGSDYINANYVNMEIPGSGIVNRYIAAQGPLPNTCTDYWLMVWEQRTSLIVMLTTKVERGRVKCHQYWPDLYETMDYGVLQITCVKEEETTSFAFREFNLTHVETSEERHISHMQYIAWPDHGVPDDPADFLDFVLKVRQKRVGMVEPTVVHCSAGIGRTGVLITMETAMCLIEANQPVYPLSIVRQMRDQRAMLIQTASQYKFVCEAILKVYNEGLVKPLEDYQR